MNNLLPNEGTKTIYSQARPIFLQINSAREKYKPERIKLLFIAEAPPEQTERFFYYEKVKDNDWLFLGIVKVLCGNGSYDAKKIRANKKQILETLQQDGIYLMDLYPVPLKPEFLVEIDTESCKNDLMQTLEAEKAVDKHSTNIVLIKVNVYDCLYRDLKNKNYKVQDKRISFPSSGGQKDFAEKMKKALEEIKYTPSENMKRIKELISKG